MGDVVSLVERMQAGVKEEEAERAMKRMLENKFDYNDYLSQMRMLSRLGGLTSMIKMLPGKPQLSVKTHGNAALRSYDLGQASHKMIQQHHAHGRPYVATLALYCLLMPQMEYC